MHVEDDVGVVNKTMTQIPPVGDILSLPEFELHAKAMMSHMAYEYVASGAADEHTLHWNRTRYDEILLRPRVLMEVGTVDMTKFEVDEGGATIGGPLTQDVFRFDPLLPAYTLLNLRLGVRKSSWDVGLFVNNLTDERAFLALDRERGTRARVGFLTNQPRTIGLSLRFDY